MRIFFIIIICTFLNGCGGTDNAEPATQETLNSNSIEQNVPNNGSD